MVQPELRKQRETLRTPNIRDIGMSLLLLLVSRASVLGMFPFGVAFFAACFDKSIAYMGITAVAVGLITSAGNMALMKYLVAALVFWIYTRFKIREHTIADASCCGGAVFLGGLVYLMYNFAGFYDIFLLFAESIAAAVMYIIFGKFSSLMMNRKKRYQTSQEELISTAVSIGVMITGLTGIVFPHNISLADIVSVYAVMSIALNGSIAAAGSGGLCIGFLASMASPSAVVMMGLFGMSALFANLLKSFGRIGVALGFLGGSAVALLYAGSAFSLPVTIIEAAIGAFLFVITPKKFREYIGVFFSQSLNIEKLSTEVRAKDYLAMRLEKTADVFRSLEKSFEDASEKRLKAYNKDVASVFDEVACRVCEDCPNAVKCWQSDFTRTYKSVMLLLSTIESKGILTIDQIPMAFREKCLRAELFTVEFNHVYELYKKNLIRTGEAIRGRDLVARQYKEMSDLMKNMSEEICSGFAFREDLEEEVVTELDKTGISVSEVSVIENEHGKMEVYIGGRVDKDKTEHILGELLGTPMTYDGEDCGLIKFVSRAKYTAEIAIRQIGRDLSEISGDSIDEFMTEDYKQYVILSDGMGSGKKAMYESHITLKLLREFLQSGFGIKTSVEMINSALCLRLDYECFSTVDLLCIDLMNGVCEFYKIGGAQSILRHGGNVETVFSVSMPVGMLSEIKVQSQAKKLMDGDVIVMMSDGVSEAGYGTVRTDWIKNEIKKPFDTMEEMAQTIIETAVKKSENAVNDDMTVATIRLLEN